MRVYLLPSGWYEGCTNVESTHVKVCIPLIQIYKYTIYKKYTHDIMFNNSMHVCCLDIIFPFACR